MGEKRYGLYFKPGVYGTDAEPLQIQVGYYTEVAGLGASPGDVRINGKIEVRNRCFDEDPEFTGCFALNNFWRGLSNLTINVNGAGQDGCTASANFWAVSQAVSLRRVEVTGGNLSLMDYCTQPSFASGGYIADSKTGDLINGSQQQWFTRNSEVGSWSNAVWNQVFAGVVGAPADTTYPDPPYTTLDTDAAEPGEAVPVRGRQGPLPGARALGTPEHPRHQLGRGHDTRADCCRSATSTWPIPTTRSGRSTRNWPGAST